MDITLSALKVDAEKPRRQNNAISIKKRHSQLGIANKIERKHTVEDLFLYKQRDAWL